MKDDLPCRDCITLAICKNKVKFFIPHLRSIAPLVDKCSILKLYVGGENYFINPYFAYKAARFLKFGEKNVKSPM